MTKTTKKTAAKKAAPKVTPKKALVKKFPTIGSIVNYVPVENSIESNNGAEVVPAIVVKTMDDNYVNLHVLTDGEATSWQKEVAFSATKEQGTWHWPERA